MAQEQTFNVFERFENTMNKVIALEKTLTDEKKTQMIETYENLKKKILDLTKV